VRHPCDRSHRSQASSAGLERAVWEIISWKCHSDSSNLHVPCFANHVCRWNSSSPRNCLRDATRAKQAQTPAHRLHQINGAIREACTSVHLAQSPANHTLSHACTRSGASIACVAQPSAATRKCTWPAQAQRRAWTASTIAAAAHCLFVKYWHTCCIEEPYLTYAAWTPNKPETHAPQPSIVQALCLTSAAAPSSSLTAKRNLRARRQYSAWGPSYIKTCCRVNLDTVRTTGSLWK